MAKSKNRTSNSAHTGRSAAPRGQHHGASDEYAAPRRHGASDEFGGTIKLAFRDHNWPASRKALLEHARHNTALDKSDIARLERIPDRKYKSVVDLVNATRETAAPRPAAASQRPDVGHVESPQSNRHAAGDLAVDSMTEYRSTAR